MIAFIARLFRRGPVARKGTVFTFTREPGIGIREAVDGVPSDKGIYYYWDRLVLPSASRRNWVYSGVFTQHVPHVDDDMHLAVGGTGPDGRSPVFQIRLYRDMPLSVDGW